MSSNSVPLHSVCLSQVAAEMFGKFNSVVKIRLTLDMLFAYSWHGGASIFHISPFYASSTEFSTRHMH